MRELELRPEAPATVSAGGAGAGGGGEAEESRAELRLRLAEAERLVRRLRADAERQRREVLGGAGVTNLLFDGAAARHAHVRRYVDSDVAAFMLIALLATPSSDLIGILTQKMSRSVGSCIDFAYLILYY